MTLMRMPRTSTDDCSDEYDGLVRKVMRSSDYILLEYERLALTTGWNDVSRFCRLQRE